MEPTRIRLSDTLRDTFVEALDARIEHEGIDPFAACDRSHEGVSKSLVAKEQACFAQAVLDVIAQGDAEAIALTDRITNVGLGLAEPAIIIENLPQKDRYAWFLICGLAALHNSTWMDPIAAAQAGISGPSKTEYINLEKDDSSLDAHKHMPMHQDESDTVREDVYSGLRFMRPRKQSNPPLTTALCSVGDVLDYISNALYAQHGEAYADINAFREEVSARLAEPRWTLDCFESLPLILPNRADKPNHSPAHCSHIFAEQFEEVVPHSADPLDSDIIEQYYAAIDAQKQNAKTALKPTELLIFNNAMLMHSSGNWAEKDPRIPDTSIRCLDNLLIDAPIMADKALGAAEVASFSPFSEGYVEYLAHKAAEKGEKSDAQPLDSAAQGR